MEATGVYWKPIYYMLEDDFELWLLNARHLKNVPGRKTDVKDAEWICQLVEHGLVRPSFVPPKEIRELRNLTRYRKAQIEERTREVQRLEKVLQDAGIKLSSVATRVLGASGRAMLDALVGGTTDPEVLAELARGRLRSKLPALRDALEGSFSSHHALMVGKILAHIDYLDESIDDLSVEIERVIAPFSEQVELLDTIPGVNRRTAETLIAEIGVDMSQFPTHRHLASWAEDVPRQRGVGGQTSLGQDPQGLEVAQERTDRIGPRRGALQGDLPCGALRPPQRPAWFQESCRGGGTLDPGDLLPRAGAWSALRGARRGLLRPATIQRGVHEAVGPAAGATRSQGSARTLTPNPRRRLPHSTGFSHQAGAKYESQRSRYGRLSEPRLMGGGRWRPRQPTNRRIDRSNGTFPCSGACVIDPARSRFQTLSTRSGE